MEGPHHNQGWTGYDPIPDKNQPEPTYGPGGPSPWPEPLWEAPMGVIYAFTAVAFETKPRPAYNNLDMARWGRETMHPRNYMNSPYFELWLRSVARWLERSGYASRAELTEKRGALGPIIDSDSLNRAALIEDQAKSEAVPGFGFPVGTEPRGGVSYPVYSPNNRRRFQSLEPAAPGAEPKIRRLSPKFAVGSRVEAILQHGSGHTREYSLYRGKVGTVVAYYRVAAPPVSQPARGYGAAYPDLASRGLQNFLVPLYSVRFNAADVWGNDYVERGPRRSSKQFIYVDMFEPYLRAVEEGA
jgi:hypothetical protein